MKLSKQAKAVIIGNAIYIAVFLIFWFVLPYFFENHSMPFRGGISAILTFIISPRITRVRMQSGDKLQIEWLFLSKAITI